MKHRQQAEPLLIFDWRNHDTSGAWLWLFLAATFLALASLFVLFRIVTPEAPAVVARPQQMILLNPAVPAERALIHRAMDRSFTLIPSDSADHSQPPSIMRPAFHPATRGFRVALRGEDASGLGDNALTTLAVTQLEDVLPQLPAPAIPTLPATSPSPTLKLVTTGRELIQPTQLEGISLLDPERVSFRVAVDAHGRVQLALPLSASENEAITAELRQILTAARFRPAPSQPLEWVEVTFAWKQKTPDAP
jgi:hypothetical protein